jgi:hypothetical protein
VRSHTALTICGNVSEIHIRFTASVLLQLTYGHRVISTADDQYVQLSEIAVNGTLESGIPGLMPVDLFPFCQRCVFFRSFFTDFSVLLVRYFPAWLPGMGFKKRAALVREDVQTMRNKLFEMAKENMVSLPSVLN